jgi:hypothetical protein
VVLLTIEARQVFWYGYETYSCFLLKFVCGHKRMTSGPKSWFLERVKSCMELDVENVVARGWVEYGSLPPPPPKKNWSVWGWYNEGTFSWCRIRLFLHFSGQMTILRDFGTLIQKGNYVNLGYIFVISWFAGMLHHMILGHVHISCTSVTVDFFWEIHLCKQFWLLYKFSLLTSLVFKGT